MRITARRDCIRRTILPAAGVVLRAVLRAVVMVATLWAMMGGGTAGAAEARLLFLSSSTAANGWTEAMLAGIKDELAKVDRQIDVTIEFLDRFRFADTPSDAEWAAFLSAKYRTLKPDVIIADAAPAILFLAQFGSSLFGPVPIIGILPRFEGLGDAADKVAVKVTTGPHIDRTVEMVLAQRPGTRKLIIVSDNSAPSHHLAAVIRAAVAHRPASNSGATGLMVEHLFDFRLEELEQRLATLPSDCVVLYTHVDADNTGRLFRPDYVAARLARVSSVPVYGLFEPDIGTGVVGGVVNNPHIAGHAAVRSALRIIKDGGVVAGEGETPYSSQMVADWRQLRRWGISESLLPADADVRYRQPSLIEAYWFEGLLILCFIAVLSGGLVVISALYVQRGRLALALGETNSQLEERVAARTHDLATASAQMHALLEFSPVPALIIGHDRVEMVNRRFSTLFGTSLTKQSDFGPWWSRFHPDPAYRAVIAAEWIRRVTAARTLGTAIEPMSADVLGSDGTLRNIQIHAVPVEDCLVIQFIDLTERKRMEEELRHIAFHDSLTRLPNRRLLLDRMEQGLHISKRQNSHLAVLFIDLNKFKQLNDTHGHDVGDMLLVEVAHRLLRMVRDCDTVARLGGDEFVVLLTNLGPDPGQAARRADGVAFKIGQTLREPYDLGAVRHHGSASIGIKLCLGDEDDPDLILKEADAAMYEIKKLEAEGASGGVG